MAVGQTDLVGTCLRTTNISWQYFYNSSAVVNPSPTHTNMQNEVLRMMKTVGIATKTTDLSLLLTSDSYNWHIKNSDVTQLSRVIALWTLANIVLVSLKPLSNTGHPKHVPTGKGAYAVIPCSCPFLHTNRAMQSLSITCKK